MASIFNKTANSLAFMALMDRFNPDYLDDGRPRVSNTGGKFSQRSAKTKHTAESTVIIDWLTLSFPDTAFIDRNPVITAEGEHGKALQARSLWLDIIKCHLSAWMHLDCLQVLQQGRGFLGFSDSAVISVEVNGENQRIGTLAWGGTSQRGRLILSLSGQGTQLIEDWHAVFEFTEAKFGKISRVDLAADFLQGQYTVNQAVQDYKDGLFTGGGNKPKGRLIDDLGNDSGKTLYVGKRENGKMCRIYEKGKQLGDEASEWVRVEGELHAKDRVIPLDVLINPAPYWAGLYPIFTRLLGYVATRIETGRRVVAATVNSLVHWHNVAYGGLVGLLMDSIDDAEKVVEMLRRDSVPRRLRPVLALHSLDALSA